MQITKEQLKFITEVAAQEAIKEHREYAMKQEKIKKDKRLRNIKLLLRNYRTLVKHVEDVKLEISILDERLEIEYLDSDEFVIESIKRSKERTLTIVRYMQKMVRVFESMCEAEGEEAKRQYQVIAGLYISEPKKSIRELSNVHFVTERTIRRDRDTAVETLSLLMFGVDSIKF